RTMLTRATAPGGLPGRPGAHADGEEAILEFLPRLTLVGCIPAVPRSDQEVFVQEEAGALVLVGAQVTRDLVQQAQRLPAEKSVCEAWRAVHAGTNRGVNSSRAND